MSWAAFYLVLTATAWLAVWPMLRAPADLLWAAPEPTYFDVPVATYDSRGMT